MEKVSSSPSATSNSSSWRWSTACGSRGPRSTSLSGPAIAVITSLAVRSSSAAHPRAGPCRSRTARPTRGASGPCRSTPATRRTTSARPSPQRHQVGQRHHAGVGRREGGLQDRGCRRRSGGVRRRTRPVGPEQPAAVARRCRAARRSRRGSRSGAGRASRSSRCGRPGRRCPVADERRSPRSAEPCAHRMPGAWRRARGSREEAVGAGTYDCRRARRDSCPAHPFPRPPRRPRRPRAQPARRRRRPAARQPDRLHRPVRLRQVLARVRHDLRRGPAPLRRVAVRLRAPVPRPDGQARRRLHRGAVAGGLDRPEVDQPQPALDRRHDHRGLRLPAPAVRPRRSPALPGRAASRSPGRPPSRSSTSCWSCPSAPASRCSRRWCRRRKGEFVDLFAELQTKGFSRARVDGEVISLDRAAQAGEAEQAHHRGGRRPARGQGRRRRRQAPAHRLGRDGPRPGRRHRHGRLRRPRRQDDPTVAPLLREAGLPQRPPAGHRRDRAAHVLVQRPVRRLPRVHRPRHRARGRPRAARPRRGPVASARARSRRGPRARARPSTSSGCSTRPGRGPQVLARHAVARAAASGPATRCCAGRTTRSTSSTATATAASGPTPPASRASCPYVERRHSEADSDVEPRALRGLHARGAVPRVQRRPAQARVARRAARRHAASPRSARCPSPTARSSCRTVDFTARERADRRAGASRRSRPGSASCSTSGWTTSRSTGPPARCPAARRSASGWRRRSGPGWSGVLYVLDEPSIGLHQRDNRRLIETLDPAARPRQHPHRRRARRGHHPRPPTGSSTSARAPACTAATSSHSGTVAGAARPTPASLTGDYLSGRAEIPTPRRAPRRRTAARSRSSARGSTTCTTSPSSFPLGCSSRSPACPARASPRWSTTSSTPSLANKLNGARQVPGRHKRSPASSTSTRSCTSTRAPIGRTPRVEPGDLHRRVRPHPHAVRRDARGEGPRLPAGPVLLQRQGRPLRGVLGRRHDQDRDELPARRLRPLRGVPRRALQPRDAGGALQGQDDRRGARHADRGGGRVLRGRPGDRPPPARRWSTSGSATSGSASRRRPSPAARRSASSSRPSCRSARPAGPSTSSTSRRPACTSRTSASCSTCSAGWSTRATRSSSSSTTST